MNLLADESVDGPIVKSLRDCGHTVTYIAEDSPGIRDEEVLALAWQQGVVLITADKDFGELVYRQRLPHSGVLLLRLTGLDETDKSSAVTQIIDGRGAELVGAFSVLTPDDLRIRRQP